MRIFIICAVRNATDEFRSELESYVERLELLGHIVHLPHRDTDQEQAGLDICKTNRDAIRAADEVHVFYSPNSQGTHFDLGMAFAMGKGLVVVANVPYGPGKSYPRMIDEWAQCG